MIIPILNIKLKLNVNIILTVGIAFVGISAMLGAAIAEDINKTPGAFQNVFLIGLGLLGIDVLLSLRKKIRIHF